MLIQPILEGNRLSLSRLLTQVENDSPEGRSALAELFPHTGRAHLIGVTGAPGTGKSSLVNQLTLHYRKEKKKKVAIIAVDPSSPFTGGAVLGDRVRMRDLSGDTGVFIRSMASRGSLGGLAQSTAAMSQVFETEPVGGPGDQGAFLNMVVAVDTPLDPFAFLRRCRPIEAAALRQRVVHWGPRTLDVDLLFYDDMTIASESLTLPHPRIGDRLFVLAPFAELEPDFRDSLSGESIAEKKRRLLDWVYIYLPDRI